MSAIEFLKKKYPALEYFNLIEGIDDHSLHILANQIHLEAKAMSSECKIIMKKIRQFVGKAEDKLKRGRKLYKFLTTQQDYLSQIIMNNQKLRSLDALEDRQFESLTQLQFSNNEIESLEPLSHLQAPSLEQIDLSSNSISFINPINQCRWECLTTLLLSQNRIVTVENLTLSNFPLLKTVNLSDNFLTKVRWLRKQVGSLRGLKKLDLSNNFIMDCHFLSQCKFNDLTYLNLQNNTSFSLFDLEKISIVSPHYTHHSLSNYEIRVSTLWARDKLFIYGYRQRSKHKLSVKIDIANDRLKRQTIQKGRKLIFD